MPFLLRKPPYTRVNCGGEMRDQEEAALCSENKKESLINLRVQREHVKSIKEYLLKKISIFMDINHPPWNNSKLCFMRLSSSQTEIKCKPYCGSGCVSEQNKGKGGVDGNNSSFYSSAPCSEHSIIDGRKTKSSANRRKIIVSRKKLGSAQQKTSYSDIFSWKLNHRSSSFTIGYSTLVLAVFLCSCVVFDTNNVFVKGKHNLCRTNIFTTF